MLPPAVLLLVDYHACHTHDSEDNNSRRVPPVPAASVTGIAQRTSYPCLATGKHVSRRCRGAAATAALLLLLRIYVWVLLVPPYNCVVVFVGTRLCSRYISG